MNERTAHTLRDQLERDIVEGRYRPGDRLDETMLAERFDVSRTPIREALHGLERSGLIELRPRRGAFVRRIGARELIEMFEVMAELEAACGRFASQRVTKAGELRIREALVACETAARGGDHDAYYRENETFHAEIYAAADNSFLEGQALALRNRLKPFRRHQLQARGRVEQSLGEHRAVVEAIEAGEGEVAAEGLRAHVVIQGEKFRMLVESLEEAERRAS